MSRVRSTYIVIVALLAGGAVAIALMSGSRWREQSRYDRTRMIVRCIVGGERKYHEKTGKHPGTIEESLEIAASAAYCAEPACASRETTESILRRRDAWGRALEFERRTLESGLVEVTVISCGSNGRREYTGPDYFGDDIVGQFYLGKKREGGPWDRTQKSGRN